MSAGVVFLIFFSFMAVGIPIAISVGWASLSVGILNPSFAADSVFFFRNMVSGMDSYVLLAVPLFMLSGNIMAVGGISDRLFDFFAYFFGKRPSGLPTAVVLTCLFYGAISGSGPATVAAIGAMCIPLLVNLGYDKVWVTAMIAVSGGLGVIIPPSIPYITYGLATGTSVGDLFIAGFLPGILIALCLISYIIFFFGRHDNSQLRIIENSNRLKEMGLSGVLKRSFFALLCPVIILGGIYTGIVTPTEAAVVSVDYAILVCMFVFRSLSLKDLLKTFVDTARTATPVMLILSICVVFGRILTMLNVPQQVALLVTSNISSPILVFIAINVFLLFVGMIMDTVPAILILAPILQPITAQYGMDPIHFGIMMSVNLAIGFVTPPIGTNLFVAQSISGIPILNIAKKALPFILMFIVALLLITYIPEVSMMLPNMMK
ncbi:MAG: TRAP transporter large permease [Sedimentibacter sp.]